MAHILLFFFVLFFSKIGTHVLCRFVPAAAEPPAEKVDTVAAVLWSFFLPSNLEHPGAATAWCNEKRIIQEGLVVKSTVCYSFKPLTITSDSNPCLHTLSDNLLRFSNVDPLIKDAEWSMRANCHVESDSINPTYLNVQLLFFLRSCYYSWSEIIPNKVWFQFYIRNVLIAINTAHLNQDYFTFESAWN